MYLQQNIVYSFVLDIRERGHYNQSLSRMLELLLKWLNAVVASAGPNLGLVLVATAFGWMD